MRQRACSALIVALIVGTALAAAGCSDKPQQAGAKKVGQPAWAGAADPRFTVPGWKAGDAESWEQQLRQRAKAQNEYERTGGGPSRKTPG
jgi:hypothetical protein